MLRSILASGSLELLPEEPSELQDEEFSSDSDPEPEPGTGRSAAKSPKKRRASFDFEESKLIRIDNPGDNIIYSNYSTSGDHQMNSNFSSAYGDHQNNCSSTAGDPQFYSSSSTPVPVFSSTPIVQDVSGEKAKELMSMCTNHGKHQIFVRDSDFLADKSNRILSNFVPAPLLQHGGGGSGCFTHFIA